MLQKLFRFTVIIALMIAIPVLWYWGITNLKLGVKGILVMTGGSLLLLGVLYKMLGSWDLIPDWIPLIGGMDDSIAWILMLVGGLMAGGGMFLGG
ncbi:hypothetical protein L6R29_17020 [Myxococcota bacterium]|nr:hypothetical protein [Myxococcota bacterium]